MPACRGSLLCRETRPSRLGCTSYPPHIFGIQHGSFSTARRITGHDSRIVRRRYRSDARTSISSTVQTTYYQGDKWASKTSITGHNLLDSTGTQHLILTIAFSPYSSTHITSQATNGCSVAVATLVGTGRAHSGNSEAIIFRAGPNIVSALAAGTGTSC